MQRTALEIQPCRQTPGPIFEGKLVCKLLELIRQIEDRLQDPQDKFQVVAAFVEWPGDAFALRCTIIRSSKNRRREWRSSEFHLAMGHQDFFDGQPVSWFDLSRIVSEDIASTKELAPHTAAHES